MWQDQLLATLHLIRKHLHQLCMVEGCQLVVAALEHHSHVSNSIGFSQRFERIADANSQPVVHSWPQWVAETERC